jgi:hypothetical protein
VWPVLGNALMRLLGALLMEYDETWTTGKRYFEMALYAQWRAEQGAALSHIA